MYRSRSLAPVVAAAAALSTTCVPARSLTTAAGPDVPAAAAVAALPAPLDPAAEGAELADATIPVVLVVLDGVRWQEVFGGVDPTLAASHRAGPVVGARSLLPSLYAALDARGAAFGAPGYGVISASGPNFVSLPGYTEIFGGRAPAACQDNDCAGASGPTIVDALRDRARADSDVAVIASWAPIGRAATRAPSRIVLSAGRKDVEGASFLEDEPSTRAVLDEGARADPRPGHDAFRPDRYTAELALRYLETRRPSFLFVGLGEPDEYAHEDDYRGYLASLRAADDFFGRLFAALDRMGERGRRSLVLVTADHGRARDYRDHGAGLPESARVWLLALGGPVHARGFVQAPHSRRLSDVAPTIRQVVGLPLDEVAGAGAPIFELLGEAETQPLFSRQ
ncbi:MAG TPA: alkaline phosphatase family protein [Polyangiaceae bacterium]|nr:alkaline phosphatase family protein [Polyangiaceae bacterium]